MQTTSEWLQSLGLEKYAQVFFDNDIDLEVAASLSDQDLKELGVSSMGHRKKLLRAIAELEAPNAPRSAQHLPSESGERRQLTVMFCDLVGSTRLSHQLDPEEVRRLIRLYQDACAGAVARYDGHVAQFLGDGVLVYFGYPRAHEGEAERAIRAGLSIIDNVGGLSTAPKLEVRIGIDTGLVVIGQGDGLNEQERTAIGDAPNVAARLQGLAKPRSIVISERARQLAGGAFEYVDLGRHELKGITEPLHAWQVIGETAVETRFDAATGGTTAPMVGRDTEMNVALQAWGRAKGGKQQVLLLCGEAGIGKSRILREIRERLARDGAEVWQYQCSPFFVNTALYPVIANMERALGWERTDSPESKLNKLDALMKNRFDRPELDVNLVGSLFSLPVEIRYGPLQMSPQQRKSETIRALSDMAQTQARRAPLLVLFEDLHWSDPTTIELLDHLMARKDMSELVVLTYRPEFKPGWIGQSHVIALTLNRLDSEQTERVATRVARGKKLPKEIIEQIVRKTDGVPLFVEELTKAILETDIVKELAGKYVPTKQLTELTVPATLHDSLMARLDRLAPTKEAAQIGACIGRDFSHELLSLVSTQSKDELEKAIDQLLTSELVFKRGEDKDAVYTFKHALVQDAAYESLLKSKRAKIHARIATTLNDYFPNTKDTEPELLAHHYTEAGETELAIPLWRKAGEIALQRMAATDAIAHLDRGLGLLKHEPSSSESEKQELDLRTTLSMAWLTWKGWAHPNVVINLEKAWELEQSLGRDDHLLRILWGLCVSTSCMGHISDSMGWAERLLHEGQERGRDDLQLAGHTAIILAAYFLGHFAKVRKHSRSILDLYDPINHRHIADLVTVDPKTYALVYDAFALWVLGYPDQAAKDTEAAIDHARARGHAFDLGWTLQMIAKHIDFYRSDAKACSTRLAEFERVAREHDIEFFEQIVAPICRSIWLLLCGRWEDSEKGFSDSIPRWAGVGLKIDLPLYRAGHAQAATYCGNLEHAQTLIDEVLRQIEHPGWDERGFHAEALRIKGHLLQLRGDFVGAEAAYGASLTVARTQQAKSWELRTSTSLARLWQSQRKRKQAHELLAPVYNWFTEGFDTKDLKEARALLDELSA